MSSHAEQPSGGGCQGHITCTQSSLFLGQSAGHESAHLCPPIRPPHAAKLPGAKLLQSGPVHKAAYDHHQDELYQADQESHLSREVRGWE